MDALFEAIEISGFAQAMRRSLFLYPLANVLHVLGLMAFFASVAAMDVAVIRSLRPSEARDFVRRVRPVAILFLLLQLATGVMLFVPEAHHVYGNPSFQVKVLAIVLALLNVVLLESALRRAVESDGSLGLAKISAVASLLLWLAAAAFGRLIAYF